MMSKIEKLLHFLTLNPSDTFTLYALALEFKKVKDYSRAITFLESCIQADSLHLASYYQLCDIAVITNNQRLFYQFFDDAKKVALQKNDPKTLNELNILEDDFS